jgi:hypothetical protein
MFVSAIALAAPALAQESTAPTPPASESTATQPPAQAQTPTEMAPAQTPQVQNPPAPQSAPAAPEQTPPSSTAQATTNSAQNVAAVVDSDFPAFDADKNGELSKTEFAAWMTKLRAAQPGATASTDTKTWAEAAFAQADTDKNKSVTKGELTTFLQG